MLLALALLCTAARPVAKAAESKPFIECDHVELVQAVPELAGIQFDPSEDRLDGLLRATGERLRGMLAKLVGISAAEEIHEMRFEDSMVESSRRESFRYVVRPLADGAREQFEEIRTDPNTGLAVQAPPKSDFLVIGHFFKLLGYLLPEYREQSHFRYLGRWTAPGQDYFVVAFAQRSVGTDVRSHIQIGGGRTALLQGIVWIDGATNCIMRLRLDLLGRIEDFQFKTLTTDISLAPISFQPIGIEFWIPARVTVYARYAGGEVHSVHRYSDYRLSGASDGLRTYQEEKHVGIPAMVATSAEDPWELLDRGISLARDNKPGEAIVAFRDALHLNPDMPIGQYHLAAELRATGDLAGAETELREALKRDPNAGPVHNFLGILLFKRGDVPGAVAELRTSAQLQPTNATPHFNLAQALEKLGDRKAAIEEYRTASTLEPNNAALKKRYEQLERASNVPAVQGTDTTIKVEVRQVLVPVIVTDKDGHHVTGLTQADFRVFEDGVEQKISGFSIEDAGVSSLAPVPANAGAETPRAGTAPKRIPIRRKYLICIDSFHSAFANLVHVRRALSKLFREERAGDSQYIVVALGASTQMVQSPTSDPADVLRAVESKEFEKLFSGSGQGSTQAELVAFRRALEETRVACDQRESRCETMKASLPSQANQIASQEQMYTLSFLNQFRALVQALGRGTERRSIILFSDGFQLVPGKEAFELLAAYFPEMPFISFRSSDRMQDLEPILRLAANSNIPVYTIGSRGLYTSGFFGASSNPGGVAAGLSAVLSVMNESDRAADGTLSEIAAATGGTTFQNSNNILNGLERAFADGRQYYVLAYVPGSSNSDGKFHAISVRVRESKMLVSAKRGYWAGAN
jgi:VWFA-related protein